MNNERLWELPIKFHKKLINESLMILLFSVNKLATDTSKEVKIFYKYDYRCLRMQYTITKYLAVCKSPYTTRRKKNWKFPAKWPIRAYEIIKDEKLHSKDLHVNPVLYLSIWMDPWFQNSIKRSAKNCSQTQAGYFL